MERAQGIYSFSHLTFQEYFTAKWFVECADWQNLVSHITEKHWREVFLLAVGMLPTADYLLQLMKQSVDALVAAEKNLQEFLVWVKQKSLSVNVLYKPVVIRGFYLDFNREFQLNLTTRFDCTLSSLPLQLKSSLPPYTPSDFPPFPLEVSSIPPEVSSISLEVSSISLEVSSILPEVSSIPPEVSSIPRIDDAFRPIRLNIPDFDLDNALIFTFEHALELASNHNLDFIRRVLALAHTLNDAIALATNPNLERELRQLKHQLPNLDKDGAELMAFWKVNGQAWLEKLRAVMIEYRNIGQDWQLSNQQNKLLKQYYYANKLLVDCLNSGCNVAPIVRQQIEDTLLLPIAEIEKMHQQS